MFPAERLQRIKELLIEKKQIDISNLSNILNVTEVTVRRDLEKLEAEGFLIRTHGGAVLVETETQQTSLIPEINQEQIDVLVMLATIAGFFIKDNDIVFLGPGISNNFFFHALKDKRNITIVTNDLVTAIMTAKNVPETKIICPSGILDSSDLQLYGRLSENFLANMNYNIAFFDVDGITLEKGYTVSSIDKAYLISGTAAIHPSGYRNMRLHKIRRQFFCTVGAVWICSRP